MAGLSAELEEFDAALASVVPRESVEFGGQWTTRVRRRYRDAKSVPGVGPHVEVVDRTWTGSVAGPHPLVALSLLSTPHGTWWAKSSPPCPQLHIHVGLSAQADGSALLDAHVGGGHVPTYQVDAGVPVGEACAMQPGSLVTGRLQLLARYDEADLVAVLIPAPCVKTGRNRLWRLRDELAAALPPRLRELMTRGRHGRVR